MPKIFSERLSMRQLSLADWELFQRLHTDPDVIQYVCDLPEIDSIREKFMCRLPEWFPGSDHWLCLVISEKHSDQAVGVTGFKMIQNKQEKTEAEIGYLLLSEQQGKGYGTESLRSIVDYAVSTLGVKKLSAVVTEGNASSCRVLEKCGFTLKSRVPNAFRINGDIFDDLIYTLIFED